MPTLYVTEIGARIEKEYGRLLVTSKDDEVLLVTPLSQVSEVVLIGSVGVTTPALISLLDDEVGLSLVTRGGRLRGRLQPGELHNLPLRHKQYACSQDERFCLEISRAIVRGKITNSRTMLRRILRQRTNRPSADLQAAGARAAISLNQILKQVTRADTIAELRGHEGYAGKIYFALLRAALKQDLGFQKRTRRPPADPVNALLSLAYSLLTNCCFTACQVSGLDAYDGFLHADKYGRPALALDLVEEFRTIVADSVVLNLVNNRILDSDNFERNPAGEKGGIYLTRRGMKLFLQQFTRRLQTHVYHPHAERALSYQKIFEVQCRQLRHCIETGDPAYSPFLAK